MSSSMSVSGFRVYDILTRIIPGTALIIFPIKIYSLAPEANFEYDMVTHLVSSTPIFLTYIGFRLVVGEILQLSRAKLHPVPYPFRRLLFHQTQDREYLSLHDRVRLKVKDKVESFIGEPRLSTLGEKTSINFLTIPEDIDTKAKNGFWSDFKMRFDLDEDFNKSTDVYSLFIAYMEPRMSSDLNRSRAVVDFMSNLAIVAIFLLYTGISLLAEYNISLTIVAIGLLTFLYALFPLIAFFAFIEKEYVNRLLIEYLLSTKEVSFDQQNF